MHEDRPNAGPIGKPLFLFLSGLALVVLGSLLSFPELAGSVFFSWDSASYVANANDSLQNPTRPYLTATYSQSLGNISYPNNFNFMPEFRLAYIAGKVNPTAVYTISSALFFASTFAMAMLFRLGPWLGFFGGIVLVLLTLPFTSPPIYTESFWWHAPFWLPNIYLTTALICAYYLIGRLGGWRDGLAVVGFNLAILWAMMAAKYAVTLFLGVPVFFLVFTLACQSWRELAWKLGGSLATVAFLVTLGPLDFLRGLHGAATNAMFFAGSGTAGSFEWQAILGTLFYSLSVWKSVFFGSLVWVDYHLGYPLAILSILGAFYVLIFWRRARAARLVALAVLLTYPHSFMMIYGSAIAGAIYPLLVLYALALGVGVARTATWLTGGKIELPTSWPRLLAGVPGVLRALAGAASPRLVFFVLSAAGLGIVALGLPRTAPAGFPYPPARTAPVAMLAETIGFGFGDRFRGRYINLTITKPLDDGNLPAIANNTAAALMQVALRNGIEHGNDLALSGLRYFDIPVTIEHNRLATPISMVFLNYLLVRDGDRDRIDIRVASRFEPRLLRLIGVRYVLAHAPPADAGVAVADPLPLAGRPDTRLYELAGVNTGQYSPTKTRLVADFQDSLSMLRDPDFDPSREAILHTPWIGDAATLVPADSAVVTRIPGGIRLSARSRGRSLLVLPFEFSRCLDLEVADGSGLVRVGRADLMLTGILFENRAEAELRFRFGPFTNPRCRLQDMADFEALGLTAKRFRAFQNKNPRRLLFEGIT